MKTSNKAWMVMVVLACGSALWAQSSRPAATTAPAAAAATGPGTVTGDNVYIRAGFSTNYYPVLKVHKGDKVNVLRSEYGWLEIAPPAGAFSLVEKSRVDKTGENAGTTNDVVQVYTGSDLSSDHYAKQVKLGKGESVRIIGETAEGDFYKITPPEGASVWISADFVRTGAAGDAPIEPVKTGELSKAQREAVAAVKTMAAETSKKKTTPAPSTGAPISDAPASKANAQQLQTNRDSMRAIEAEIADELRKDPTQQNLEPMVGKLNVLAEQSEDITAQIYAKSRIEQLRIKMELAAAVSEMQQLRTEAVSKADEIAAERARQKAQETTIKIDDIAARGEIRVSGLYDGSGGRAKRWRLVDPKTSRTIAYFELAPGSAIDPVQYYGKYVGVRATSYQLLHGTVPPLPVYVVESIEVQDPNKPVRSGGIQKEAIASPAPKVVPASQPSVSTPPATRPAAQ